MSRMIIGSFLKTDEGKNVSFTMGLYYLSKYLNIVHLEFEMKPERKKNDKKKKTCVIFVKKLRCA